MQTQVNDVREKIDSGEKKLRCGKSGIKITCFWGKCIYIYIYIQEKEKDAMRNKKKTAIRARLVDA